MRHKLIIYKGLEASMVTGIDAGPGLLNDPAFTPANGLPTP